VTAWCGCVGRRDSVMASVFCDNVSAAGGQRACLPRHANGARKQRMRGSRVRCFRITVRVGYRYRLWW
jgi:hypothetical protein